MLAKEYYHEVKSPAFYHYNQLKRLSMIDDPIRQKEMIDESIKKADELNRQMERALRKIARDDYAKNPKPVDLGALVKRRDRKFTFENPIEIVGDGERTFNRR